MGTGIFELSDRAVEAIAEADPITATYAGVGGHDHRWGDLSPEGHLERRRLAEDLLAQATSCTVEGPDEVLARQVLVDSLEEAIELHEAGDHLRDLNNIVSPFQVVHDVLDVTAEPDDLRRRLLGLPEALEGYRRCLAEGLARGLVASRRQVLAAIEQGRAWSGPAGFAEHASGPEPTEAVSAARDAYASLADWLEGDYLPHAPVADGVGEERYLREARRHLGSTIDPGSTYEWGWQELGRLRAALAEVCGRIGPGLSVTEVIELLRTDPDRGASTAQEFLSTMLARQEEALAQLAGTHFDLDDRIRAIEVRASPPGGALAPHYTPPSEDFSRPGVVWYPLGERSFFPLWEEVTTAHHEGFPGHHLQVGTQMSLGDRRSRFHRLMAWKPGSGEGWALYAEQLMAELGFLDRPAYEAGLLAAQLFRSARIVIDIGLHLGYSIPGVDEGNVIGFHPGESWDYGLAVEMLTRVAFVEEALARSEVVRYMGWPAQAISYKLGERAILDLRAERIAAADASAPYDPVGFHSDVLGVGAVGLDLLTATVRGAGPARRPQAH